MKHKRNLITGTIATLVLVSLIAVCASPLGVTAAAPSANVRAPATLVGAVGVGTPAISYDENGTNFFIFARGTDGALWYAVWNHAAWSSTMSLGGYLTSDPTVTPSDEGLWVAVRGGDGAFWANHYVLVTGVWGGWQSLGGQLLAGTSPTSGCWLHPFGNYMYGWFVTGTDHALYGWNVCGGGWQNLGGYLTSSPGAAAPTR